MPRPLIARQHLATALLLLLLSLFGLGCDGHSRPIEPMTLSSTLFALPSHDFGKRGFFAASVEKLGTLIGDDSGLFHLSNNKLNSLSNDPVRGIVPWRGKFLLIAGPKQLQVFDGTLQDLPLQDKLKLGETQITAIAVQASNTLWIGTQAQLWRLHHDTLTPFPSIQGVKQLSSFVGAREIVVQDGQGVFHLLREQKDGAIAQMTLPSDARFPDFQRLLPGLEGALWGLSNKRLFLREETDQKSRWVRYLLDGANPDQSSSIEHVTLVSGSGRIWLTSTDALYSLQPKKLLRTDRPTSLKQIQQIAASQDGSLWISDGKNLHQFVTQNDDNITYSGQVSLFMKANCWRCHTREIGPGRPLDSYELVKKNADAIIQQVQSGNMPSDKKPLTNGDVNIIKKWVKNQYAK